MSNSTSARTWVLDTASSSIKVWNGPIYLAHMEWHPSAANQSLEVTDGLGHTVWKIQSITAGNDSSVGIEEWKNPEHKMPFDGFCLKTMDTGGILYVTVI